MKNIREAIMEGEGEKKEGNYLTQEISNIIYFPSNSLDYKQSSDKYFLKTDKNIFSSSNKIDREHPLSDLYIKDKSEFYIKQSSDLINSESNKFISGKTEKIESTDVKEKLSDISNVPKY